MSVSDWMTIGELAKVSGVPVSTIRFYERKSLIKPESRSQSNYRLYAKVTLKRLEFIRSAQSIGLTLADIKQLLGSDGQPPRCGVVKDIIQERLEDLDQKMSELQKMQSILRRALTKCKRSSTSSRCHLIDTLQGKEGRSE